MNVKPRLPRKDINCVNCGECIIACKKELGDSQGLFSYKLGNGADEEAYNGAHEDRKVVPEVDYKSTKILNT
jgi:Fe-S-cluster-containing dehydrogenase component